MRLIYSSAQNTLGWIGPDWGTAALAVNFLRKFNREPEKYIRSAKDPHTFDEELTAERSTELERRVSMAIKKLFEVPFFHRVWIIQELGLARRAQLCYGLEAIDWIEVSQFVFIFNNQAAFLVNCLQLRFWTLKYTNLIWPTLGNGWARYSFVEVLNWARIHQATDPRDCIYGFFGHPRFPLLLMDSASWSSIRITMH